MHVDLVWHDNVHEVPSNHQVSLKVLETVSRKLEASGELELYNKVFLEQLEERVIEEFNCPPKNFHEYNWLPHRPVWKYDK